MSVIKGQINIKNNFSRVADVNVKLKSIIITNKLSCNEFSFYDILPSTETNNTSFSATVTTGARESLAILNVVKITVELKARVRSISSNDFKNPLEYHIYEAKFKTIDLPLENGNLNIIICSERFNLIVSEIGGFEFGNFDVMPILVHSHQLNPSTFKKSHVSRGCPISLGLHHSNKAKDGWLFKFIFGQDKEPSPVLMDDLEKFTDNFGMKLAEFWKNGLPAPFNLRNLLNILSDMKQRSFVVADGAHIQWTEETKDINRHVRLVVTFQSKSKDKQLIYILSSPVPDSDEYFLQVAAWSDTLRAFNYYQRNNKKEWWWLGNSWHALKSPTRGKGPFDGHVNGSLVMKELNRPWLHWNSQLFTIFDCLGPEDPLRYEPVFENRSDASDLEHIVKNGIFEWNIARLDNCTNLSSLDVTDFKEFMRQIIDNTTYNIIAIDKEFSSITPEDDLIIPASFFINIYMVNYLSDYIDPDLSPIKVRADMYLKSIEKYGTCLKDEGKIIQQGDGMFAFPVPEPAYEDNSLLIILLNERKIKMVDTKEEKHVPPLLSYKFILCLLMIDFCNPLDSRRRSQLLDHIPETAYYNRNTKEYNLVDEIVRRIKKAAKILPKYSTEATFLKYWNLSEEILRTKCKQIIEQYFTNLQINLKRQDGVDDLVRLADSRRRMFRRKPLSEYDMTFPICSKISSDALMLEMTPLGTVRPVLKHSPPLKFTNSLNSTLVEPYILKKFDTPAFLNDMNSGVQKIWDSLVKKFTQDAIKGYPDKFTCDGPRLQYYDPTSTYTSGIKAGANIVWTAFPNKIRRSFVTDKKCWEIADSSRDVQDEYCEWSVLRGPDGKIIKVTFTCEAPEYWDLLAKEDPGKTVDLYKNTISSDVKKEDLFGPDNKYISRNIWNNNTNSGNIMHLTHENNTLKAEIELAACSSVVRVINGRVLATEQELIKCGKYGDPDRFSDPHIGANVNSFARQFADVTIRNPVAIYLNTLDTSAFMTPDNSNAKSYWKFVRGNQGFYVRGVYEVPADKGFCVGDIKINGKNIDYGAQIAEYLTVRISAVACRIGESTVPVITGCREQKPVNPLFSSESSRFMRLLNATNNDNA